MVEVVHSTKGTEPFYCDGQPCFEVLIRRYRHSTKVEYWCGSMHSRFDAEYMTEKDCPKNSGKLPESRFDKWNGLWSR